jgi:GTP cyclohydrolase II
LLSFSAFCLSFFLLLLSSSGYYRVRAYQIARQENNVDKAIKLNQDISTFVANKEMEKETTNLIKAFTTNPIKTSEEKDEVICMIIGDVKGKEDVPMRVHDQCFTSEVFGMPSFLFCFDLPDHF